MNEGVRPHSVTWLVVGVLLAAPSAALGGDDSQSPGQEQTRSEAADETDEDGEASTDRRAPPFRLAIGPLSALRRMTFEGNERTVVHAPRPYFGGTVSVSGTVWRDDHLGASLSYDLEGGYGVARNAEFEVGNDARPVTEMSYGTGHLLLNRRLGGDVLVGVGGGVRAASVITRPNPVYTGHRYLAADTSIRLRWFGLADHASVTVDIGTSPVFALDNSSTGHGDGSAFGARAETQVRWTPVPNASSVGVRNLQLLVRYRYQRFRSQFPESFLGTDGAVSVDNQHIANVLIAYAIGH